MSAEALQSTKDDTSASPESRGLVSIVLVTLNEREHIANTVNAILEHVPAPVEVIVVDDNSPDETWKLVQEMNDPRVILIRRMNAQGLASAFLRGIMESRGDYIGWMDADTCMPPSLLPEMLEKLKDHDVAIGSRYAAGGEDQRHPIRTFSSRLINGFSEWFLGHGVKDSDSGFVLLHRHVFDYVLPIPTGYGEYFIEFVYGCHRKGLKICEHGYVFRDRTEGYSKSFQSIWQFAYLGSQYVWRIIRARFRKLD